MHPSACVASPTPVLLTMHHAHADSFAVSRGFMMQPRMGPGVPPAHGSPGGSSNQLDSYAQGLDEMVQSMQVEAVKQSGRMLGQSSSMNAADWMRFRDVLFEQSHGEDSFGMGQGALAGLGVPKRKSDGMEESLPPSRRGSHAAAMGALLGTPAAGAAASGGAATRALATGGSQITMRNDGSLAVEGSGGSFLKPMSRAELLASLQQSAARLPGGNSGGLGASGVASGGTSGAGVGARGGLGIVGHSIGRTVSFNQKSPAAAAAGAGGRSESPSRLGQGAAGHRGSVEQPMQPHVPAQDTGHAGSHHHAPVGRSKSFMNPSTSRSLQAGSQASAMSPTMAKMSRFAAEATSPALAASGMELQHELAKLKILGEKLGSGGAGGEQLWPQPPPTPPSLNRAQSSNRLGSSFTASTSPLAQARAAMLQQHLASGEGGSSSSSSSPMRSQSFTVAASSRGQPDARVNVLGHVPPIPESLREGGASAISNQTGLSGMEALEAMEAELQQEGASNSKSSGLTGLFKKVGSLFG